jgi:excisionase family DNA binding protein
MPVKAKKPRNEYVPVAPSPEQKYLNVRNVAAYLGASVAFVRHELVYAKAVPFVRLGVRIIFDRTDLDAFMAAQKEAGRA